jgi:hypothetical protein
MKFNLMSHLFSGDVNLVWIDCKIGKYWYVFEWKRKKMFPFLYRSIDATPPEKMIFGKYS